MNFQVKSTNEWLYPDDTVAHDGMKTAVLHGAKNGYVGFQVLLNDLTVGACYTVKAPKIPGLRVEMYELVAVLCEKNTGPICFCVDEDAGEDASGYTTRRAPFRVYDGLKPLENYQLTATSETMGVYFSIFIESDGDSQRQELAFYLKGDDEKNVIIPVTLTVYDVAIANEKNLAISNWYRLDNIAAQHHVEMFSEEHWRLIEKYADLMARTRQTHFWIPNEIREISRGADGKFNFDFTRTKRLIDLFLSKGFTHIEGNLIYRRNHFSDTTFVVDILDETVPALSEKAYEFVSQYLTAWRAFLAENGWLDKLCQHVGDEPTDACKEEYRMLSGIVRKFLPGVPLMEAVETFDLDGAVDIWIPKNNYFDEHRDKFERIRGNGEMLWFYTCCYPGGKYLNRLWDMPLIRTRLLHWGNYRYDLRGYLHWGFNWCDLDKDPFNQTDILFPPGDTHISYPAGAEVWGSMRLEAMRAGVEDYELLLQLSRVDKGRADDLCRFVLLEFDAPNEDVFVFEGVREKILQRLGSVYL